MTHYPIEKWKAYVNDELTEYEREEVEQHLYSCDRCLELYMAVIEQEGEDMPVVEDERAFTEAVLQETTVTVKKQRKPSIQKKTVIHYVIAASMTLTLMTTGFFEGGIQMVSSVEQTYQHGQIDSFSAEVLNYVTGLFELLEANEREG
ncbi:anti-sigma factor family protein [Desertibacillus haloalkaliphilus]|uniref:anti-sigma factor family protein n=1 Tax=Desertibacillus haloalkaliphilus TaxID=1328930 RepID=UPI001C27BE9B|nr:zf-HC2 domain-containing protein [Desertibacillus haloalkaliphilus]MBU8906410.1 hypothetical protein [Desertibacillus haloalkaliphilus]